jgi:ferredoxin-NADP reductase
LSAHLVNGVEPGTIIRLQSAKGEFALPNPPPEAILFITAGSGITPVMAMLRSLRARGQFPDIVHVHSAASRDAVIFSDELREIEQEQRGYRLHLQLTEADGKVDFDKLDDIVADWRDRSAWACGPAPCSTRSRRCGRTTTSTTRCTWSVSTSPAPTKAVKAVP